MKKHVKIDKKRLERFEFKPVKDLKQKIEKKPELKTKLRKDFRGTLEAQGIEIDENFEEKIRKEWRNTNKSSPLTRRNRKSPILAEIPRPHEMTPDGKSSDPPNTPFRLNPIVAAAM